jgi:hypothetical protein
MKNIAWAIRHPLYALSWLLFKEPYSAVKQRILGR